MTRFQAIINSGKFLVFGSRTYIGPKGKVNSHFFARFGGAILQSVLDVGVQLAARKATGDTVIVGLPGSTPQVTVTKPDEVRPTLTVKEGTSVSVFVVHDLDFTEVER